MPYGDGTGPVGAGPMTGRAAGYCAGYGMPGYMNRYAGYGLGRGRGFGFGRGWGRGVGRGFRWHGYAYPYPAYPVSAADEKEILKRQTSALEAELKAMKERLDELEKEKEE